MGKILFAGVARAAAFAFVLLAAQPALAQQALTLEVAAGPQGADRGAAELGTNWAVAAPRTVRRVVTPADLVLTGGTIVTLKAKGDRAQAVAVRGDRIVAVGDTDEIRAYIGPETKVIELQGRTVTPGFNDAHQHPSPIYTWEKPYASLELDTVTSMRSLIALLRRKAAVTPKGMVIRGTAYNEVKLGGQPIRDSLDEASTDHPIIISQASGHVSAVNSYMLRLNHITKDTQDPPGGAFERYPNGAAGGPGNAAGGPGSPVGGIASSAGEPDGIVKESARGLLRAASVPVPKPTEAEEMAGYRLYFHRLLESGITSLGDCWTTPAKVTMYRQLVAEGFPLRFNLYIGVDYLDDVISGKIPRLNTEYIRIQGIKIFHGNSLSGKTCWLYDPYDTLNPATGKRDYYGIAPARSQAGLDSLVLKIHRNGLQIACHSNGDREIDMVLAAIEYAQRRYPRVDARHRIEHCSIVNDEILDRLAADSVIPVIHSYANELGDQLRVYGAGRLRFIMATRSAQDRGIVWAMHSDFPVSRYEPMYRIDGAVNRIAPSGMVIGANQRIGPEDAIYAYCVGGAYTSHEEGLKGRIAPGQLADMVVLEADPTTVEPAAIRRIGVDMTIVGGRVAYQR